MTEYVDFQRSVALRQLLTRGFDGPLRRTGQRYDMRETGSLIPQVEAGLGRKSMEERALPACSHLLVRDR